MHSILLVGQPHNVQGGGSDASGGLLSFFSGKKVGFADVALTRTAAHTPQDETKLQTIAGASDHPFDTDLTQSRRGQGEGLVGQECGIHWHWRRRPLNGGFNELLTWHLCRRCRCCLCSSWRWRCGRPSSPSSTKSSARFRVCLGLEYVWVGL